MAVPNQPITKRTIKAAFEDAFNLLQAQQYAGRAVRLEEWAEKNPTEFYKLCARMLPQKMDHAGALALQVVTGVPQREDGNSFDDIA